jgi:hypothetical protein
MTLPSQRHTWDSIDRAELLRLATPTDWPCVSIYLPTDPIDTGGVADQLRLKNLLRRAEGELIAAGIRTSDARELLAESRQLARDLKFWAAGAKGLAMFLRPGRLEHLRTSLAFDETVVLGCRYHIKPLLPLLGNTGRWYILVISQHGAQLIAASTCDAAESLSVPGMPADMAATLNHDGADRGSQVHTAGRHGQSRKQDAVFHGQGGKPETHKDDLAAYFRTIDAAVHQIIHDQAWPIVLAGVGYLLPIYRSISDCPHILDQELTGNFELASASELRELSWPLVEPLFLRGRQEALARFAELAGTGRTMADLTTVVPAAYEGRVDTIFVDVHATQWGTFDPSDREVRLDNPAHRGDEDLVDLVSTQTLLHGGEVHTLQPDEMPGGGSVAAVLRY